MVDTPNARPMNGDEIPANAMAIEMLKNLVRLNDNIEKSHRIQEAILESLSSLGDYHESYMRAMEMLIEQSDEGKVKFSLADLARAMSEAAAEVMPDDGEEEDEHGPEDPRIAAER